MNSPGSGTFCVGLIVLCLFISSLAIGQDQKFFARSFQSKSDKKTEYVRKYFKEGDYTRIEDYVRDTVSHKATIYGLTEERIDAFAFYCIALGSPIYYQRDFTNAKAVFDFYEKGQLVQQVIVRDMRVRYVQVWDETRQPVLEKGSGINTCQQNECNRSVEIFRDSVLQESYLVRACKSDTVYNRTDVMASPKGGLPAFATQLAEHVKYPGLARLAGKEGRVYIEFIVDEKGDLTEFRPLSKEGYNFEEKTLKNLKKLSPWNPAILNGRPVKTMFVQPLHFKFKN